MGGSRECIGRVYQLRGGGALREGVSTLGKEGSALKGTLGGREGLAGGGGGGWVWGEGF